MWSIGLSIVTLVVVFTTHWVYRWRNPKCKGNLPPGSMGWPLIGETLEFFTPNRTWDTPPFIKNRMKRYGSIFQTSLVGQPVIVSTDSDLNYMVFQQEGKLFKSWYPDSMKEVFGRQIVGSLHGCIHKYLRNMTLSLFGPGNLKSMLYEVENVVKKYMERWNHEEMVELRTSTADMILDLTAKKLISYDLEKSSENLRENFDSFIKGIVSFPFAIPGTLYHKCLQGRKKVILMLRNMLEERRSKPNNVKSDFFDYVLEELEQNETTLTEEIALDFMVVLLFASFETTSLAIIVAIKFLTENSRALKELTEEHEKILAKRENSESGLSWEEYKSMKFTFWLINETTRLANIVPGVFRKAMTDIKFKDYTIPSGWVVMISPPALHLNPISYMNPLDFDPWRWEGIDIKGASKSFMAFGGGLRFCVGADFARLEMAVFLHCLVTKYRWHLVKGGETVRNPGLHFPNGFHVQFSKKDEQNQHPTLESTMN